MYQFCTKCGKEIQSETGVCPACSTQAQPQFKPEKNPLPFDEPASEPNDLGNPTNPFNQPQSTSTIQAGFNQQDLQTRSQCPHCGGAGGIYTKSEITTGGFVYLAIMIALTFFFFVLFFPCAIIPFALIFLVFLFKQKYFACINCGQRVN